MKLKRKIFIYFSISGFLGGLIGTLFLLLLFGNDSTYLLLGFDSAQVYYTFPILGALLSGGIAACSRPPTFGATWGAGISFVAFIAFNLIVGLLGSGGIYASLGFTLFGFVMFGWVLLIIGAVTGWLIKRSNTLN